MKYVNLLAMGIAIAAVLGLSAAGCAPPHRALTASDMAAEPDSPPTSHGTAPLEPGATDGKAAESGGDESQPRSAAPATPSAPMETKPASAEDRAKGSLVKFYGVTTRAAHVVYVIDRSDSMNPYWTNLHRELFISVGDLWLDQDFMVVLMGENRPLSTPSNRLVQAIKHNQAIASDYVRQNEPTGETNPVAALRYALAALDLAGNKGNKVIYFVTDRSFLDSQVLDVLNSLNRSRQVEVDTFLVGRSTLDTADTLKKMADQNGGKFVKVEQP